MRLSPDVTVVIPTRDRWPFLDRAIASALAQESVNLEVVVVDDGSVDETAARLATLGERRLRVVRHSAPEGLPRARNAGIAAARGTWLAFLDDDDLWAPHKLRTQLAAAMREDASLIYGSALVVDARYRVIEDIQAPDPFTLARALITRNVMPAGSSNVLAERRVVEKVGGFDVRLPHLADWDLWIRLTHTVRAGRCSDAFVAHVHHPGNMLLRDERGLLDELAALARKHSELARRYGARPDPVAFRRWIAWGNRRAGRRWQAARWYAGTAVRHASPGDLLRAGMAMLGERPFEIARRRRHMPPVPDWLAPDAVRPISSNWASGPERG